MPTEADALHAVDTLLRWIGEDPARHGLVDTPRRVAKALREMTCGYSVDVGEVLSRSFDETSDELVVVTDIEFTSLCEHHVLPFMGTAVVGYLPGAHVVGLSKLPRVVDAFAQRLQVQERLTHQIAQAVMDHAGARGAGVVLRARHSCMGCRGVRKPTAQMVTSALLGSLREPGGTRDEFLRVAMRSA